jgi:hypothetical protein
MPGVRRVVHLRGDSHYIKGQVSALLEHFSDVDVTKSQRY